MGSTRRCLVANPSSRTRGFLNRLGLPAQINPSWDFQRCAGGFSPPRPPWPDPAPAPGRGRDAGTRMLQPCNSAQTLLPPWVICLLGVCLRDGTPGVCVGTDTGAGGSPAPRWSSDTPIHRVSQPPCVSWAGASLRALPAVPGAYASPAVPPRASASVPSWRGGRQSSQLTAELASKHQSPSVLPAKLHRSALLGTPYLAAPSPQRPPERVSAVGRGAGKAQADGLGARVVLLGETKPAMLPCSSLPGLAALLYRAAGQGTWGLFG